MKNLRAVEKNASLKGQIFGILLFYVSFKAVPVIILILFTIVFGNGDYLAVGNLVGIALGCFLYYKALCQYPRKIQHPDTKSESDNRPATPIIQKEKNVTSRDLKWLKEHWFKAGILLALFAVAGSISYYFLSYVPQSTEQEATQKSSQKQAQASLLQTCLDSTKTDAETSYYNYCATSGLHNPNNCNYQLPIGGTMLTAYESSRDSCFKQFPQN